MRCCERRQDAQEPQGQPVTRCQRTVAAQRRKCQAEALPSREEALAPVRDGYGALR